MDNIPMDADELAEKLEAIAEAMGDDDPEWAIHDYEWEGEVDLGKVEETDSIQEWNERCEEADGLDEWDLEEIQAAIEAFGYSFSEAMERQQAGDFIFYPGKDLEGVAEEIVDECYITKDTPEIFTRYFDYGAFACDLGFEGYTETNYGVIYAD